MNRLRADLVLLLVALIWGSAFAVQRVAARYFDTFTFNGLRFLLGGIVLLPFSGLNPVRWPGLSHGIVQSQAGECGKGAALGRKSFAFMLGGGALLFGAAGLQQLGLETTTAGNAGFITTLYTVLVPVLLVLFWRERIHWLSWLAAGVAIIGSLLLSTAGSFQMAKGDAFEMAGALFWALHVILVSRAVRHMDVLTFSAGQYIVAGSLNLVVSLSAGLPMGGLAPGWWTVAYIGLLSTAGGYTLQAIGQKFAPPTDATILLSMEAVFAALTGFLFLEERMKLVQLVGCGLIIGAVLITQLKRVGTGAPAI
jgi:drug/metabolite transporter (DMT)-like permease